MSVLTQPADMAPLTRAAVAERLKGAKVDVPNTLYKWGMFASLGVTLAVLVLLVGSVFGAGIEVLLDRGLEFLTVGNSSDPAEAGMWQAIFGSALIAVFVVGLAFPLGHRRRGVPRGVLVGELADPPHQHQHPQPGRGAVHRLRPPRPVDLREGHRAG